MRPQLGMLAGAVALLTLPGCEGSDAAPAAGVDSCRIAQRLVSLPTTIPESSGAAVGANRSNIVWTHNDSGGGAELFGVNAFGQLVAHVRVAGAENVDWEDIAAGPCPAGNCLYIGDIGDNAEDRAEVVIYRIPEPSIETDVVPAEAFPVRYPDGPQDAEGLFVLPPDQLFVVTKGAGRPISIYRYPGSLRAGEVVELELVRRLTDRPVPLSDRVTAADATPDGRRVALRTRTTLLLYDTDVLLGNVPGEPANVRIEMLGEPQGEGVAFGPRGAIVLTGEAVAEGFASTLGILWCP